MCVHQQESPGEEGERCEAWREARHRWLCPHESVEAHKKLVIMAAPGWVPNARAPKTSPRNSYMPVSPTKDQKLTSDLSLATLILIKFGKPCQLHIRHYTLNATGKGAASSEVERKKSDPRIHTVIVLHVQRQQKDVLRNGLRKCPDLFPNKVPAAGPQNTEMKCN